MMWEELRQSSILDFAREFAYLLLPHMPKTDAATRDFESKIDDCCAATIPDRQVEADSLSVRRHHDMFASIPNMWCAKCERNGIAADALDLSA